MNTNKYFLHICRACTIIIVIACFFAHLQRGLARLTTLQSIRSYLGSSNTNYIISRNVENFNNFLKKEQTFVKEFFLNV
jgi:hypothetical protein